MFLTETFVGIAFPTQTRQLSSRIKILDGTLDGGLDVVKCTFSVAEGEVFLHNQQFSQVKAET